MTIPSFVGNEEVFQMPIQQFKIKVGQRMGNNTDVWPNRTEEVITIVRQMVDSTGENITLFADANGAYTEWKYVEPTAKLMEENNYLWLEEPTPWYLYIDVFLFLIWIITDFGLVCV